MFAVLEHEVACRAALSSAPRNSANSSPTACRSTTRGGRGGRESVTVWAKSYASEWRLRKRRACEEIDKRFAALEKATKTVPEDLGG